jgi:outer membrane protein assembly factor BamB
MPLRHTTYFLAGLFLAALTLAACGRPTAQTWPGLSTDNHFAYVAQGSQVHAINVADGKEAWAFPAAADANIGQIVSQPGISPQVIVVGSEGATSSYSGVLYGLDPATGQRKWCLAFDQKGAQKQNCPVAHIDQPPGLFGLAAAVDNRILGGMTLTNGVVYFGLASGYVLAVDVAKGTDLWHYKAQRDVWAEPVVDANNVYISSLDHNLYALDRASGLARWQKDLGAAVAGAPTLADGTLYVGTLGNKLYALDAANGNERWPAFVATNWVWGGPTINQGVLYFTDVSGTVFAIHADTGQQIWAQKPGGAMRAHPVLAGEALVVGDHNGNLFGLKPADGTTIWQRTMKGQLLVPALVISDGVLVAPYSGDNLLAAYSVSGDLKWAFAPSK